MSDIAHDTRKNLAESERDRHRSKAEKALQSHEPDQAAAHLRQAADAMEQLASLETLPSPEARHREQAERFRSMADELEAEGMQAVQTTATSASGVEGSSGPDRLSEPDDPEHPDAHAPTEEPGFEIETPDQTFSDVGGLGEVKQTLLDKVADPIRRSDLYAEYGIEPVRGVLFQGPPGTGKTLLGRALGGELEWDFIELTPAEINSALVGEGAKNIQDVFQQAREHQPCILFFDEIENIAKDRTSATRSTRSEEALLTQLLTEMNDLEDDDVIVIGATNQPEEVDDALLNARRFSEVIEFPLPNHEARKAIIKVHLRERPVPIQNVDFDRIAELTDGFSGADLEQVADNAAHHALDDAQQSGQRVPITQTHIEQGITERRERLADAEQGGYLNGTGDDADRHGGDADAGA